MTDTTESTETTTPNEGSGAAEGDSFISGAGKESAGEGDAAAGKGDDVGAADSKGDKAAGDKADGKDSGDAEKDATEGAPEEYEAFTLPEGVEVDEALHGEFTALAKEHNLTQAQAQQFVDLQLKAMEQYGQANTDAWNTMQQGWKEEIKNAEDLGAGKEVAYRETQTTVAKAVEAFGTDALREALKGPITGDHPELVRFFKKIGEAVAEGSMEKGQAGVEVTAAKKLYPNMN